MVVGDRGGAVYRVRSILETLQSSIERREWKINGEGEKNADVKAEFTSIQLLDQAITFQFFD